MAANALSATRSDIPIGEPTMDLQGGLARPISSVLGARTNRIEAFGGGEQSERATP